MALTKKRRVFVEEYLKCWNASEAARCAGYAHPGQQGHRLLKNVEIAAEIQARIDDKVMSADEALIRLSEIARAEYSKYIEESGYINLPELKRNGKMHLVKAIYETKYGKKVEFHSVEFALDRIGRHHGQFVTRHEISGTIEHRTSADEFSDDELAAIARGSRNGASEKA